MSTHNVPKGWSASPCCALVMLSDVAQARVEATQSSSFACDLKKWLQIMQAYEQGGHAYHATMPSDALARFRDAMLEAKALGFDRVRQQQQELGDRGHRCSRPPRPVPRSPLRRRS